ncbi:MAG: hypothetical protein EBT37_09725 [Betaproteobacteria bacterium]|nr:hypothetical protein [Betaproteobacteria bacterium]
MDHSIYAYSALPQRPAYPWPAGRGLAAYVVLFLEHWELLPPEGSRRDPRMVGEFGSFTPDYRSWSQREYGLRVSSACRVWWPSCRTGVVTGWPMVLPPPA